MNVDLVLPCLDEAEALPWVLSRVPDGCRAIVVDNGSTDGSQALVRELAAEHAWVSGVDSPPTARGRTTSTRARSGSRATCATRTRRRGRSTG